MFFFFSGYHNLLTNHSNVPLDLNKVEERLGPDLTNKLKQITKGIIAILNYACETTKKIVSEAGWLLLEVLKVNLDQLCEITRVHDFHRLDRELDHLRALGLIGYGLGSGGFDSHTTTSDITLTSLALQMYVRCKA